MQDGEKLARPEVFAVPEGEGLVDHLAKIGSVRMQRTSLFMKAWVVQGNGERVGLNTLIDTGCEVNLVRKGLISPQYFTPSVSQVRLVTANGEPLGGGDRQVMLRLFFT